MIDDGFHIRITPYHDGNFAWVASIDGLDTWHCGPTPVKAIRGLLRWLPEQLRSYEQAAETSPAYIAGHDALRTILGQPAGDGLVSLAGRRKEGAG